MISVQKLFPMFSKEYISRTGYLPHHAVRIFRRMKSSDANTFVYIALDECMSYLRTTPEWRAKYGGSLYRYIIGESDHTIMDLSEHTRNLCRHMMTYVICLDWDIEKHMMYMKNLIRITNDDGLRIPLMRMFSAMQSAQSYRREYGNDHKDISDMFSYLYEYEYDAHYDPLKYRVSDLIYDTVFDSTTPSRQVYPSASVFYCWLSKYCEYAIRFHVRTHVSNHKMLWKFVMNDIESYHSRKAFRKVLQQIRTWQRSRGTDHNVRDITLFHVGKTPMIMIGTHRGDDDTFLKMFGLRGLLMKDVRQYHTRKAYRNVLHQIETYRDWSLHTLYMAYLRKSLMLDIRESYLKKTSDADPISYASFWRAHKDYMNTYVFPELRVWGLLIRYPYEWMLPIIVSHEDMNTDEFCDMWNMKRDMHRELLLSRCFMSYTKGYRHVVSSLELDVTPSDLDKNYSMKCQTHIVGPFYQRLK